jgi:branched-chain amino acid transport system substrate-binding protein
MAHATGLLPAVLAVLLAGGPAFAQSFPRSSPAGAPAAPRGDPAATPGPAVPKEPELPSFQVGALLPLTGPSAWFGREIRQGIELALAELNQPRRRAPRVDRTEGVAGEDQKGSMAAMRANAALPPSPGVKLVLEAADVQPLDIRRATAELGRLAAGPSAVVFTASPTPTLAVQQAAAARDVLLVHLGQVTGRFPPGSRTILHARPSPAARAEAAAAYAAERKLRRLALVAAGDEFGKTVRSALAAAWRERGGTLQEESLSLDAPDVTSRLRQLVRRAPEAVVLGFRGAELGDLVARLREVGYTGPVLVLDDDPAALLAAGVALEDATVVTDAFAPELGSAGVPFAEAYAKKYGGPPSRYAAAAYDAVVALAAGVRAAMDEKRGPPGGARLREHLMRLRRFPSVFGGQLVARDDGMLARPLALFTVDEGVLAFVRYVPPGRS